MPTSVQLNELAQKPLDSPKEDALMTAVDFAAFVGKLADIAAETILPFFRTALGTEDKSAGGAFDPVTEADHAAEAAMRRLIIATFPHHGVIGEELGSISDRCGLRLGA